MYDPPSSLTCWSTRHKRKDVFHIVDKVENVLKDTHIFDLINNVEFEVYAFYSSVDILKQLRIDKILKNM